MAFPPGIAYVLSLELSLRGLLSAAEDPWRPEEPEDPEASEELNSAKTRKTSEELPPEDPEQHEDPAECPTGLFR